MASSRRSTRSMSRLTPQSEQLLLMEVNEKGPLPDSGTQQLPQGADTNFTDMDKDQKLVTPGTKPLLLKVEANVDEQLLIKIEPNVLDDNQTSDIQLIQQIMQTEIEAKPDSQGKVLEGEKLSPLVQKRSRITRSKANVSDCNFTTTTTVQETNLKSKRRAQSNSTTVQEAETIKPVKVSQRKRGMDKLSLASTAITETLIPAKLCQRRKSDLTIPPIHVYGRKRGKLSDSSTVPMKETLVKVNQANGGTKVRGRLRKRNVEVDFSTVTLPVSNPVSSNGGYDVDVKEEITPQTSTRKKAKRKRARLVPKKRRSFKKSQIEATASGSAVEGEIDEKGYCAKVDKFNAFVDRYTPKLDQNIIHTIVDLMNEYEKDVQELSYNIPPLGGGTGGGTVSRSEIHLHVPYVRLGRMTAKSTSAVPVTPNKLPGKEESKNSTLIQMGESAIEGLPADVDVDKVLSSLSTKPEADDATAANAKLDSVDAKTQRYASASSDKPIKLKEILTSSNESQNKRDQEDVKQKGMNVEAFTKLEVHSPSPLSRSLQTHNWSENLSEVKVELNEAGSSTRMELVPIAKTEADIACTEDQFEMELFPEDDDFKWSLNLSAGTYELPGETIIDLDLITNTNPNNIIDDLLPISSSNGGNFNSNDKSDASSTETLRYLEKDDDLFQMNGSRFISPTPKLLPPTTVSFSDSSFPKWNFFGFPNESAETGSSSASLDPSIMNLNESVEFGAEADTDGGTNPIPMKRPKLMNDNTAYDNSSCNGGSGGCLVTDANKENCGSSTSGFNSASPCTNTTPPENAPQDDYVVSEIERVHNNLRNVQFANKKELDNMLQLIMKAHRKAAMDDILAFVDDHLLDIYSQIAQTSASSKFKAKENSASKTTASSTSSNGQTSKSQLKRQVQILLQTRNIIIEKLRQFPSFYN